MPFTLCAQLVTYFLFLSQRNRWVSFTYTHLTPAPKQTLNVFDHSFSSSKTSVLFFHIYPLFLPHSRFAAFPHSFFFFPKPFLESLTKNNTNKKCQNPFASPPAHWWYLSPFYLLSVKLSETCLFPLLPFPFPDFIPTYTPQTLLKIKDPLLFHFF